MENVVERRLRAFQYALVFMAGLTLALAVVLLAGDLRFGPGNFPSGWSVLWLVSLIGCLPLGIVMLIGPTWRSLPLANRRGTALGFMAIGLLDLMSVSLRGSLEGSGPGLWMVVVVYGLIIVLTGVATQPRRSRSGDDLFP